MSEAVFEIAEELRIDAVIGLAAMHLAPTPATYEALIDGSPVSRSNLVQKALEEIGEPLKGPPIVLDLILARRIEANRAGHLNGNGATPDAEPIANPVQVVSLEDFIAVREDVAPPLIGTDGDALLPAEGLLFMYGDGGAGKTTLSIDAMAHLASGTNWLANHIARPLTTLLIENEGPRGPFRQTLAKKVATWAGAPFTTKSHVLEEPWTRFTLAEDAYREGLGQQIHDLEVDLVIVGPLASLGAKGAGTPDDVTDFSILIGDLRARAHRPFALWIVHHENKQGDVSGAWERLPDTLVHVSAQGNGCTRVHWRKVRWSSRLHNTSIQVLWDDGGFTLEETKARDLRAEILANLTDRWMIATEVARATGANVDRVREELRVMAGEALVDFEIGPAGRSPKSKCYRLRSTDSGLLSRSESVPDLTGQRALTDSPTPPIEESVEGEWVSQPPTDPPDTAESVPPNDRDDIPF